MKKEFIEEKDALKTVEQEISILKGLNNPNIVNIIGFGSDGTIEKRSGRQVGNLIYLLLEYVSGGLIFDVCQTLSGLGENGGRFFLNQMLDVL